MNSHYYTLGLNLLFSAFTFCSAPAFSQAYFDDPPALPIELPVDGSLYDTGAFLLRTNELSSFRPLSAIMHFCEPSSANKKAQNEAGRCRHSTRVNANSKYSNFPVGEYLVTMSSGSRYYRDYVPVKKDVLSQLTAKEVRLPEEASKFRHAFFVDFTNLENQKNELHFIWNTLYESKNILRICQETASKTLEARAACEAWIGREPLALKNTFVRFTEEGKLQIAYLRVVRLTEDLHVNRLELSWQRPSYIWVGSLFGLDSISLFPGVYGFRLESIDGVQKYQYGFAIE